MSAPEQVTRDDGYDMALRFRPTEKRHPDLAQAVAGILTEEMISSGPLKNRGPVRLRVLQPVIGSEPSAWELRLTVSSLADLGEVLDWANKPDGQDTIVGRLTRIDGFDIIDDGVPLYRAWRIPRRATAPNGEISGPSIM